MLNLSQEYKEAKKLGEETCGRSVPFGSGRSCNHIDFGTLQDTPIAHGD